MGEKSILFIGTLNREAPFFQGARGKGIAACLFDLESGVATPVGETTGIDNPTYLAVHPTNGCLYAVSEVFGWNEGTVSAYRFDETSRRFVYLNKQPTLGSISTYCSIDRTGRFLFVANYAVGPLEELPGKSLAIFPLRADGGVGPAVASAAHQGGGPNVARQERPHAHCVLAAPDKRHVFVADLGIDKLVGYRFDEDTGTIHPIASTSLAAGAGPRHFTFHPDGRHAYVINELDSTIATLSYDSAAGTFAIQDSISVHPGVEHARSQCAGIQISADGRFVYGAIRGHDSIVICAIDRASGRLTLVGREPTRGGTLSPRLQPECRLRCHLPPRYRDRPPQRRREADCDRHPDVRQVRGQLKRAMWFKPGSSRQPPLFLLHSRDAQFRRRRGRSACHRDADRTGKAGAPALSMSVAYDDGELAGSTRSAKPAAIYAMRPKSLAVTPA
jgi:6-phosphogluconolactonase